MPYTIILKIVFSERVANWPVWGCQTQRFATAPRVEDAAAEDSTAVNSTAEDSTAELFKKGGRYGGITWH